MKPRARQDDGPGFLHILWGRSSSLVASAKRLKTSGTRLALAFSAFVLAIIWLSIASFCWSEWRNIHAEAERDLIGAQNVLHAHISRTYNAARNMLTLIDDWLASRSTATSTDTNEKLVLLIDQLQRHDEQPISIRLISSANTIVRSVPEKTGALNTYVGDRDYIHALKDAPIGSIYVSAPIVSRVDGRTVLPVVLRCRTNDFGIKYISAVIPEADLVAAYGQLLTEAASVIGIVRADGTILFTLPTNPELAGKVVSGTSDIIAGEPGDTPRLRDLPSLVDGGLATTAYTRLAREPLAVFASFQEDDLHLRWLHRVTLPFLLAAISSVVVLAFSHWLIHLMRNSVAEAEKLASALVDAQAASQAKQQFLANMSHELRTPLNAIIGFSEVLTTEAFGPLGTPSYRGYAQDIHDAGRHLLEIIKDILDTAKMDAGKIELGNDAIHLESLLDDCRTMLAGSIAEKHLVFTLEIDAKLPILRMDPVHLKRVLINLIGNAVKFTPEGGRIDVTATRDHDGSCKLMVADTGIGIPASRLDQLFRPFSQVAESLHRNHDGIGLGLVNTRLIIEAYGGRVWLTSTFGHGTQAYVTLPASRLGPSTRPRA